MAQIDQQLRETTVRRLVAAINPHKIILFGIDTFRRQYEMVLLGA